MTDFQEEQKNEIEALESIYPDELTVLDTEPYHLFTIDVHPQENEELKETAYCTIQFRYVPNYPDEPPHFEIIESDNLEDDQLNSLTNLIKETIDENLGIVLVFTVVSVVQEKISEILENSHQLELDEVERKRKIIEEAEQKKFEGTRVSVETFMSWKSKFDAEMDELKKKRREAIVVSKKMTGREMFMTDASMNDSDVKFLESEEDSVEVDESLFQDMDDLDIDDELDLEETAVD